jgi:hypothetical protein
MNIIRYYYTKSGEYRTKWEVRGIRLTDAGREADGGESPSNATATPHDNIAIF